MKVKVKKNKGKEQKTFPKLMISKDGWIVLFTKPNVGTCLSEGHQDGVHHDEGGWFMPHFTDFNGTITLSND